MCKKLTSKIVYTTSHPKLIRVLSSLLGCIVLMCMAKEYCQARLKVLMKVQQAVVFLLSLSICSSMGNHLAQSPFLALNLTLQFYFKGKRRGKKKSSNANHTRLSMGEVFSQEYLFLDLHLCCMILLHRYLKRIIIKISPCG